MALLQRLSSRTQVTLALIAAAAFNVSPAVAQQSSGYSGAGRYQIQNVASGKVLDVDLRDGHTLRQWDAAYGSDQLNPPNNARNQQWDIEDAGFGFVHIKSAQTGLALDVEKPAIREAVPVILSGVAKMDTQLWRIEDLADGTVKITSRIGKSLDLPNGSRSNGTHFQVFPANPGDNQKFRLIRVDGRGERFGDRGRDEHHGDHDRGLGVRESSYSERAVPENPAKASYELGYSLGLEDSRSQVRRSYGRHRGQYNPQFEEVFIEGYYDGYDNGHDGSVRLRDSERGSYDAGYRLGRQDAHEGRRQDYTRYVDRFDPGSEPLFRRGYTDGFHAAN
jgi:hypothetical protein